MVRIHFPRETAVRCAAAADRGEAKLEGAKVWAAVQRNGTLKDCGWLKPSISGMFYDTNFGDRELLRDLMLRVRLCL